MKKKLTFAIALVALFAVPASVASAASSSPPLVGGKYVSKNAATNGKHIVIKVSARNRGNALRGVVRYPCANLKARFRTFDGTFTARARRGGRPVLRVRGSFRKMNKVVGSIKRLGPGVRYGACPASKFRAKLRNAPRVSETTISYGPFTTGPSSGHGHGGGGGGGHNVVRTNLEKPCEDCAVVAMVPELREADGRRGNFNTGSMLHHAVFVNHATRDATCAGWPERFFASGNERTPTLLPRGYGYRVAADDRWSVITHLMNMEDHPKDLFIELTYYYVEGAEKLQGVDPFWLDINNCGSSEYMTPAGPHTEKADFVVNERMDGEIVAIGGHLHDYGKRIRLVNKTSGETICGGRAGYGRDPSYQGHIESVGGCTGLPVAEIAVGDRLRLLSRYDAPEPIHDVMGIMVGYVAPS